MAELETLGLTPDVLQDLLRRGRASNSKECLLPDKEERTHPLLSISLPDSIDLSSHELSKVVYELGGENRSGEIVPRLRLWLRASSASVEASSRDDVIALSPVCRPSPHDLLWNLQEPLLKHKLSWSSLTDERTMYFSFFKK